MAQQTTGINLNLIIMRKITNNAANAFISGSTFKDSNTSVERRALIEIGEKSFYDAVVMLLFGNVIAVRNEFHGFWVTNSGWESNTTKERLNALPNVSIQQKKGVWYLNGAEWDGKLKQVMLGTA